MASNLLNFYFFKYDIDLSKEDLSTYNNNDIELDSYSKDPHFMGWVIFSSVQIVVYYISRALVLQSYRSTG